jgi:N-methylhydantoinase B
MAWVKPAAAARSVIGDLLPDVVFRCLSQALPDGVPAEGTSGLWNLRPMGGPDRVEGGPALLAKAPPFHADSFQSGGAGALPRAFGLSATQRNDP